MATVRFHRALADGAAKAAGAAPIFLVDPAKGAEDGDGSAARPFKTIAQALTASNGGEIILLAPGEYPAVTVSKKFPTFVTLRAQEARKAVLLGGALLKEASHVRLEGLNLTWPKGKGGRDFISVRDSDHVEILDCEIYDDPAKDPWEGYAVNIRTSKNVLVKGGKMHHVFFGLSAWRSEDIVFDGCDIGPWYNEDGVRFQEDCKRVAVQNCRISNDGLVGRYRPGENKHGHIDAIQIVFGTDDLTIRNNYVHNVVQGISAFGDNKKGISRKNWRVEGNVVYDVFVPHAAITIRGVEGLVASNNTVPEGSIRVNGCKDIIFKNNILAASDLKAAGLKSADYNLWIRKPAEGTPLGAHDLVGVDPKFVNAPSFYTTTKWKNEGCTRTHLVLDGAITGKLAVGDTVELLNSNYMTRDGVKHKVTKVDGNAIDVAPGLQEDPVWPAVHVYKWPQDAASLKPDYRLRPDSPAVDSGDGSAERSADMDGHAATDGPNAPKKGPGEKPSLDRGAYEYIPATWNDGK
jgi:hypothetical protein